MVIGRIHRALSYLTNDQVAGGRIAIYIISGTHDAASKITKIRRSCGPGKLAFLVLKGKRAQSVICLILF